MLVLGVDVNKTVPDDKTDSSMLSVSIVLLYNTNRETTLPSVTLCKVTLPRLWNFIGEVDVAMDFLV